MKINTSTLRSLLCYREAKTRQKEIKLAALSKENMFLRSLIYNLSKPFKLKFPFLNLCYTKQNKHLIKNTLF